MPTKTTATKDSAETGPLDPDQAAAELANAEAEAGEAERLESALEERITSGDGAVTADELHERRSLVRFARLRVEAARHKRDRAQAEAADRRRTETVEAIRAELDAHSVDHLAARYAAAQAALVDLIDAVQARADVMADAYRRMLAVGFEELRASMPGRPLPTMTRTTYLCPGNGARRPAIVFDGELAQTPVPGDVVRHLVEATAARYDDGLPQPFGSSVRARMEGMPYETTAEIADRAAPLRDGGQ